MYPGFPQKTITLASVGVRHFGWLPARLLLGDANSPQCLSCVTAVRRRFGYLRLDVFVEGEGVRR